MAASQTSKQATTKAEAKVDPGAITNKPGSKTERQAPRRDTRKQSRPVAAQTDRAGVTAATAPEARSDDAAAVHGKPKQARPRSKPVAPRGFGFGQCKRCRSATGQHKAGKADWHARVTRGCVGHGDRNAPWLPHTVRAAITGLRKAGREVTRSTDANNPKSGS